MSYERVRRIRKGVSDYDYLIIQMTDFKSNIDVEDFKEVFSMKWEPYETDTITIDLKYVCVKDKDGLYFTNPDASDDVDYLSSYIKMHEGFIIFKGIIGTHNLFEVLDYFAEVRYNTDAYFSDFTHLGGYKIGKKRILRICYDENFKTPSSMKKERFFKKYDYLVIAEDQDFEHIDINDSSDSVADIENLDGFCGIRQRTFIRYKGSKHAAVLNSFFYDDIYKAQVAFEGPMTITEAFAVKNDVVDIAYEAQDMVFNNIFDFKEIRQDDKLILVIQCTK